MLRDWQTGTGADGRLVGRYPSVGADAVAALEHAGHLVLAVAVHSHYDGDCIWAGRHDCSQSFLRVTNLDTGETIAQIPDAGGDHVDLVDIDGVLHTVVANWFDPVRCWNLATGESHVVFAPVPPEPVLAMAVRWRSGRPFVFCHIAGAGVRAWGLAGGDFEQFDTPLRGWPAAVGDLGGILVLIRQATDETVEVHRLDDGALLYDVAVDTMPMALALAGSVLAIATPGQVELQDLATHSTLPPLTDDAQYARLNVVGQRLVTAGNEIRVWDLAAAPPSATIRHTAPIVGAIFVGDVLVTADLESNLLRWNSDDGTPLSPPLRDRSGRIYALAQVGRTLLTAGGIGGISQGHDSTVRRWDSVTGTQITPPIEAGHHECTTCLAVTEWKERLVLLTAGNDGYLSMWDLDSGERLRHELTGQYMARNLLVAPIQGRPVIAITRTIHEPVRFLDLDTWAEVDLRADDWRFDSIHGILSDEAGGPTMVTTDGSHTLRLWSLRNRVWRARDIAHEAPVLAVAVADAPRPTIAVAYADRSLGFIDPFTGDPLRPLLRLPEDATALAIGPNGKIAACYGIDVAVFTIA